MQQANSLVLEILKQDQRLSMSLFEQGELPQTIRHYSQCFVSFIEINKLCEEIIFLLNKVSTRQSPETDLISSFKKIGQLFWDNLLTKEVKEKLKNTQSRRLVLLLDEELINIPWEFLYDGGDFFSLKFSLGRLVRTSGQINQPQYRNASNVLKMLILANPTNDLKSAYLEGKFIKNQFDHRRNQIKIDFKSTQIDTLYVKKNLADYDIVHFAGHCEYDKDNSRKVGWVLSDGKFTAGDILNLGQSLALPNLIFSNACHSAAMNQDLIGTDYQDKTYNLAAAFLFSGVRHYLGSIWKIEDPVSLEFAKEFYTQLTNGESVGEAVRQARLHLIKEYGLGTIFWASYLLYGDPDFVFFRTKSVTPRIKLKRKIWRSTKPFAKFFFLNLVILSCLLAYLWLPTKNPNLYFSFWKSKKLFLAGKNELVISLSLAMMEKDPLFLEIYPLLADTYRRLGDKENAIKVYFAYAFNAEKKNDKKRLASAYTGIAWTYQLAGDYSRAFEFYQKAISLSRENHDQLNEAAALEKLAVWHIDKEDYGKALELLTKSSEINRQRQDDHEHRYHLACDYFDLGLVFENKNDFTTAREFYQKSQALFQKLKLKYELSDCYFNLGEMCLFEKEYQKALFYYQRGLSIDRAQGNILSLASDYDMIGDLYLEMNNLEEAEKYFEQAVSIAKEINALPELASVYYNLGRLSKQKRQKGKAREYFRLAQELYCRIGLPAYEKIKQEFSD